MLAGISLAQKADENSQWGIKRNAEFTLNFTQHDSSVANSINEELRKGLDKVRDFFNSPYKEKFGVYIFRSRKSLDEEWRKSWGVPDFNSECWMVASGVGSRLDLLSPLNWKNEACEHNASDSIHVNRILTHELVHVYHGQINPNHDFAGMDEMGWFVEGLAVLVSGQLTDSKIYELKEVKAKNLFPLQLKNAWSGKYRYPVCGSLVRFVEKKYGREILFKLMKCTRNDECLKLLKTTEADLLDGWRESI
jgi:hypothetical protein